MSPDSTLAGMLEINTLQGIIPVNTRPERPTIDNYAGVSTTASPGILEVNSLQGIRSALLPSKSDQRQSKNNQLNEGINLSSLKAVLNAAAAAVKSKLQEIKSTPPDEISIAQMFEMQLLMNRLAQLSEMATNLASTLHTAIMSITRNIKG